jgi:NodT family efflux transporter outer membrane factor (OMF) lipoprotein
METVKRRGWKAELESKFRAWSSIWVGVERGEVMFLRWIFSATFGIAFALTACTVGPDYVKPTTEIPVSYKEAGGWKMAEPKDHLIRGAWWKAFKDPELDALEEQVNVSNQSIAAAEAQFRQALALVRVTRAAYFPTVTTSPAFARSLRSSNSGSSTGSSTTATSSKPSAQTSTTKTSPVSDFLLPASVSWEPDIWGKVRRSVESSKASAQASAADLEATRLLMQTELAQDYFLLRSIDAQKQLLDATVTAYQKTLDLTNNRYASGIASKADVFVAETQLKSTQAQAIDLGVQRAQVEHAIAVLVGKPASLFSIPVIPLAAVPPPIPVGLPSDLLEQRPDIAAAERQMAAANAQIGVAIAAYYPTVTLSGAAGFEASTVANWLAWPSRFWAVGATVSQIIFEGGLRRAQTAQARAAYEATIASYRETVLTGFQEVEDNLAALRILEEENQVQDEAVKAARQSLAVAMNQYKAGIVSYLNVLVVQVIALNNEKTAIDIQGRRMIASVLLVKALGGGWNASALSSADGDKGKTLKVQDPAEAKPILGERVNLDSP